MNPDLTNARSDRLHRLPVVWIHSLLDASQLETSQPSCESRDARRSRRELPSQMSGLPGISHAPKYTSFCMVTPTLGCLAAFIAGRLTPLL